MPIFSAKSGAIYGRTRPAGTTLDDSDLALLAQNLPPIPLQTISCTAPSAWSSDAERSAWKASHPGCPEPPPFQAPGANDAYLPAGPSQTTLIVGAVAIAGLAWFFTR